MLTLTILTDAGLQNLALNIADKGFSISVYNRTYSKTEAAVARAKKESRVLHNSHELMLDIDAAADALVFQCRS